MNKNDSRVEYLGRIYRVKTSEDIIFYIESMRNMNKEEEIDDICSFFSNYQIIFDKEKTLTIDNNIPKIENKLETKFGKDDKIDIEQKIKMGTRRRYIQNPLWRVNELLKFKGEFTSDDYKKYMRNKYNIELTKYVINDDMHIAIRLKRLEDTGKKFGRFRIYKIIDSSHIENLKNVNI